MLVDKSREELLEIANDIMAGRRPRVDPDVSVCAKCGATHHCYDWPKTPPHWYMGDGLVLCQLCAREGLGWK